MAVTKKIVRVASVAYDNGATALTIATFRKIEGKRDLKRGSSWGIVYSDAAELRSIADALMADLEREVKRVERESAKGAKVAA